MHDTIRLYIAYRGEKFMKIAIIGSRTLKIDDIEKYIPDNVTEIVSGGAMGVDLSAREYAVKRGIKLSEFLPEYEKYKKGAPLKRNLQKFLFIRPYRLKIFTLKKLTPLTTTVITTAR